MNSSSEILKALENESIEILRETAAAFRKPVLLYSIGKDSAVLLHLAAKAFYPAPIPIPRRTLTVVTEPSASTMNET